MMRFKMLGYPSSHPENILQLFWIIVFVNITLAISAVHCGPHEDRLINDILNNRLHNPYGRPVKDEATALEVKFQISLLQIIDVNEKQEMFQTNLWLRYEWFDYNLGWNESEYGNVPSIRLPPNLIWTPDILMFNSADEDIDNKFPTNVVVTSDGMCSWIPLGVFMSSCSIDIRWFPFDDQRCSMKFGSWNYDGGSLNLTKKEESVDLRLYQMNGEWDLIEGLADRYEAKYDCCPHPFIDITYTFHIRRRTLYYGFNLIIPCALISMLALLTFLLPSDDGGKIGLGITILLALSVFQLIVAETVPATSLAVPLIGVYFTVVMVMTSVSIIMTVLVLNFHHRTTDMYKMSPIIRVAVCDWLAWLLRMSRPGNGVSFSQLKRRGKNQALEKKFQTVGIYQLTESGVKSERLKETDDAGFQQGDISAILNEIRFITGRMIEEAQEADKTNDWKWAAMVIDRLCFWVFTAYFVIATLVVFLKAPHLF